MISDTYTNKKKHFNAVPTSKKRIVFGFDKILLRNMPPYNLLLMN